ncbi:MAG: hypothetical protein IKS98_04950 [Lachnospiraceae bacterium]|nr:hypothetical protein [Lachnospiraceae bacterium]
MLKSNEQRIAEMHKRAAMIVHNEREAKAKIYYVCAGLVAAAAMFFIVFILPGISGISGAGTVNGSADVMVGSIFTDGDALNYIVVGICAFVLGVILTIFCYRLNKWKKEEPKKEDK